MSFSSKIKVLCVLVVMLLTVISCEARKKRKKSKRMVLRQKETNPINFIRLAAMRLIYGFATRMGLGDQISEALGGAFVPPGVDDDYEDYGNTGVFKKIDEGKNHDDEDDGLEIYQYVD